MPEVSKESGQEAIAKERKFSPSQSESEHETVPRDRRADVAEDGGEHTSAVSSTWPYPPEVASKLEKLKRLRRIPIGKEPRILDLVAKFSDFPWAQDTVMAAHQLEDVLISYLYQTLEIPGTQLHRWRDSGELMHRALLQLAELEAYGVQRPDIEPMVKEYKSQA